MNLNIVINYVVERKAFLLRLVGGVLLSVLSAFLIAFSLAGYNAWLLMWFGFVPALVAHYHVLPREGYWSALGLSVCFGGFYLAYLVPVFWPESETDTPAYIGLLPMYIFMIVFAFMARDRKHQEDCKFHLFPVKMPIAFTAVETVRLWIPIAASWGWIGYSQVRVTWLIQPISIFGTLALNFLIFFVNWTLGLAAIYFCQVHFPLDRIHKANSTIRENKANDHELEVDDSDSLLPQEITLPRVKRYLIGCAVITSLWILLSLILWGATSEGDTTLRVATISGVPRIQINETTCGFSECGSTWQGIKQDNAGNLEWLRQRTLRASKVGAKLVVFPEKQFLFDPFQDYGSFYNSSWLSDLAVEAQVYLSFAYGYESEDGMVIGAGLIDPQGNLLGTYGKDHPVVFQGETSSTSGTYPTYKTPFGTIGQIICYDLDFTDTTRKMVQNGAQIILIPSGDWPGIVDKHYVHVAFRAVENRVTLVKADKGYDSAVINSKGDILASCVASEWNECTIYADVHPGKGPSAYTHGGDWVGYIMIALWAQTVFLDTVIARIPQLRKNKYLRYYFEPTPHA